MRASAGLITNKHSGTYHKVLLLCLSHCWELAEENGAAYLLQEVFLVSYGCSLSLSFFFFLPAVVTVAFGFSAASGCLPGYFLIKSHCVLFPPQAQWK